MNLQVFNFKENEVRTIMKKDNPYFCLKDVCDILGLDQPSRVKERLNEPGVTSSKVGVQTGIKVDGSPAIQMVQMTFINESNLYKVIFQSRKPEAEQFTEWVTSEVLPSIRKNGGYINNQENLDESEIIANALLVANKIIERKNKELEMVKPKVELYDQMMDSKSALYISEVAKMLNDKNWGQKRLFQFLRNAGVLMNSNIPYQRFIDSGYFRVVTSNYKVYDEVRSSLTTLVLPKGINYIRKLLYGGDS